MVILYLAQDSNLWPLINYLVFPVVSLLFLYLCRDGIEGQKSVPLAIVSRQRVVCLV